MRGEVVALLPPFVPCVVVVVLFALGGGERLWVGKDGAVMDTVGVLGAEGTLLPKEEAGDDEGAGIPPGLLIFMFSRCWLMMSRLPLAKDGELAAGGASSPLPFPLTRIMRTGIVVGAGP